MQQSKGGSPKGIQPPRKPGPPSKPPKTGYVPPRPPGPGKPMEEGYVPLHHRHQGEHRKNISCANYRLQLTARPW